MVQECSRCRLTIKKNSVVDLQVSAGGGREWQWSRAMRLSRRCTTKEYELCSTSSESYSETRVLPNRYLDLVASQMMVAQRVYIKSL